MKKSFLSILLTVFSAMSIAQVVQENEAAVVYYMPKTDLIITINYDVTQSTPGILYQYAERYLGSTEVITEATTTRKITDIQIESHTSADPQRAYKLTAQKGINTQLITLSEDGRLLGYNIPPTIAPSPIHTAKPLAPKNAMALPPLLEEQLMAGSIAKMAENTAKQIYHIREIRLNLLAGDVDNTPADGQAMQLVLDELNRQEQMLVALFVGTSSTTHHSHTLTYAPNQSVENEVICRFSQHNGIVDANDLSGEPIYLTLEAKRQTLQTSLEGDKKAPLLSQLYYNLPGSANVKIAFNHQTCIQRCFEIAQYGVAIPFTQDLFTAKTPTIIHINPATGNILSIQQ